MTGTQKREAIAVGPPQDLSRTDAFDGDERPGRYDDGRASNPGLGRRGAAEPMSAQGGTGKALPAPIIVSALFGPRDFAWLNGLRLEHFPPERNQLDAHLTLFHHLPPSIESELKRRLARLTQTRPPVASAEGLINLGRGVAIRIQSPALDAMRDDLASAFDGLLIPQDTAGWRPRVTIQNKASRHEARTLLARLSQDFRPKPVQIVGLAAWWYRDGPWELLARYPFR